MRARWDPGGRQVHTAREIHGYVVLDCLWLGSIHMGFAISPIVEVRESAREDEDRLCRRLWR